VECLRSRAVNTTTDRAAWRAGARRLFLFLFGVRPITRICRKDPQRARAERIGTPYRRCRERRVRLGEADLGDVLPGVLGEGRAWRPTLRGSTTSTVPHGTWFGGREKAPAACARQDPRSPGSGDMRIESGATGRRPASYCFHRRLRAGIDQIMHCDRLISTPINLGSSELISHQRPGELVERIAA